MKISENIIFDCILLFNLKVSTLQNPNSSYIISFKAVKIFWEKVIQAKLLTQPLTTLLTILVVKIEITFLA